MVERGAHWLRRTKIPVLGVHVPAWFCDILTHHLLLPTNRGTTLRIWGSGVRISSCSPAISISYVNATVLESFLERCLERCFPPDSTGARARARRKIIGEECIKGRAPPSSERSGFPSDQAVLPDGLPRPTIRLERSDHSTASAPSPGQSDHANIVDKEHLPLRSGL
jgi:hypothetical protein